LAKKPECYKELEKFMKAIKKIYNKLGEEERITLPELVESINKVKMIEPIDQIILQ
jgi:hypothetical protein